MWEGKCRIFPLFFLSLIHIRSGKKSLQSFPHAVTLMITETFFRGRFFLFYRIHASRYFLHHILFPLIFACATWWKWELANEQHIFCEWKASIFTMWNFSILWLHKNTIIHIKYLLFRSRFDIYFFIKYITLLRAYIFML